MADVSASVSAAASLSGVVSVPVAGVVIGAGVDMMTGEEVVDVSVELEVLELPPAGDGFTIVVLVSALAAGEAPAAGATVSVFCSQAAKSAALARMQMYFFMFGWVALCGSQVIRRKRSIRSCLFRSCYGGGTHRGESTDAEPRR